MEVDNTLIFSRYLVFAFQIADGCMTQIGTQRGISEADPFAANLLANREVFLAFKFLLAPALVILAGKIANDYIVRKEDKNFNLYVERIVNILWVLVIINNALYIIQSTRTYGT